ncbi:hypothetical protein COLO4_28320 [Corchorus olitorius]|uniref:Uncharacterized protein n=1 Tax=Corchorus olitorius TaxID=93759 RepID=A0A1R3HM22_9ROSI|nr:hypothetical protein COLO4_28320 [Corchorus olitorius]
MDDIHRSIVCAHNDRKDMRLTWHNQISLRLEMQIWLAELRSIGNGECQGSGIVHPFPQRSRSIGQIHRGPSIEDFD